MTVRRSALRSAFIAATAFLVVAGCSSEGATSDKAGLESPRAVLDAYLEAARTYDLETDCNLLTPGRRVEMASFDGLDADTYCATVTAPIIAAADEATKARSRGFYTDPTITSLDRSGGTWFSVVSADGTYSEEVEAVEIDGRWWVGTVESDLEMLDEENPHEGDEPMSPELADTDSSPTTGG